MKMLNNTLYGLQIVLWNVISVEDSKVEYSRTTEDLSKVPEQYHGTEDSLEYARARVYFI
ncbi:MAG: hypothetical protein CM15mV141_050 [uncultured marine virus]|nr:MAG: hypothetical protein CM15mV141_050 [uncultured marine virus]